MRFPRLTISACQISGCMLALAGAIALSPGARAQANCDMYGKLAMQQQQENAEHKCGFSGPQWSPDMKAHISWCGGVGPDQWKAELQARQQKLDACKSK
ncbi:hypothetical protein [Hyphomicrobium sp.]|uniref:hypothetical protein n=1 Tax=Hyphomicrobium sp. TaxID=82 RepID=UPI003F6F4C26